MKPVLVAENLQLFRSGRKIFHIKSLTLQAGEVLALVGPNGAGKTSLLLSLALLEPPTAGTIYFNGEVAGNGNTLAIRRKMAVVFQDSLLLDMSVHANLMTALRIRGIPRREAQRRVERWLHQFSIAHLANQPARSLSGGEAQRASLARAFAMEPELLFLDEPFAALDYPTRNTLLQQLGPILKKSNIATLLVTHDYTEIPHLASRVAVMYEGSIAKDGSIQQVFGDEILKRSFWTPWHDIQDAV